MSKVRWRLPWGRHGKVTRPTREKWQGLASMGLREGCGMLVEWETEEGEVHRAERSLGGLHALNL